MQTGELFSDGTEAVEEQTLELPKGPFASVAIEDSLDKLLDYTIPRKLLTILRPGQRVRVPLGRRNRPVYGYVISIHEHCTYPKIKPLLGIDDERVLITPKLMELSRWMSRYYVAPLGTVLDSVIPSAVKKRTGLGHVQMVRLAQPRDEVQALFEKTKAAKRRQILTRILQIEEGGAVELFRIAADSGSTPATVRKLAALKVISVTSEIDLPGFTSDMKPGSGDEGDILLNEDQQKVFDDLRPRMTSGAFSVNLLLGVTGSGKTEVYLQCIREIVRQKKQAIVLVPEIALTPQTVRRFTARFPRVAILHSGLTATVRHRYWQQIMQGDADVVVGARSAIFAPLPNLGIIVVDEEHESSYKQDSAPRYHGRDVAIKRAQLEGIPVLLGSATPSLETYWRVSKPGVLPPAPGTPGEGRGEGSARPAPVENGMPPREEPSPQPSPGVPGAGESGENAVRASIYHFLSLPRRVRGISMPAIELIDMKTEARLRRGGIHLLSTRLEHLLRTTLEAKRQAIILLNRRGYSNFVYCNSCQAPVHCKYCDTTMTYHRSAAIDPQGGSTAKGLHTGQLHCHYCLAVLPLPEKCPTCEKKLTLFGLGTQRVEEELKQKFPEMTFARVDSDSMHNSKDYEALLGRFANGEIQVMLGTQMIAKGLDYPNVTLVGVISGDTALALPDFRAAERTFQLITQVAGRAGRGDNPGRVVLQTFLPDDPTIQAAMRQDFSGFANTELISRKQTGFPPYTRMVRVVLRDQDINRLNKHSEELAAQLAAPVEASAGQVRMKGPMPCAINRIAGYYRNQILLTSPRAEHLQKVLAATREEGHLAHTDRIAVDVDPTSLL